MLRHSGPIENVNESAKTWPGLNVPNGLGQVGAGGTEADAINQPHSTFSRILTCSSSLVKMRAYKEKMDRVQDPQSTIQPVKRVSVEQKNEDQVVKR